LIGLGMNVMQNSQSGGELVRAWRYQVDAEKAGDARMVLGIEFTDAGDTYLVELRNSILEITSGPLPAGTAKVSLTAEQLRAILAGKPAPAGAGDAEGLQRLLGYLDRQSPGFYMHVR